MQIESRKKKLCLEPLRGIITQGEKMADAVTFRLPATYGALVLSDLSWQIRAASEKNTLVTADLTPSSGGEFCLVQWEVSADFTAVSGALSLMLVGTDSKGNVVIKFPGDDPIWIRDSETGEYTPPPDALERAVIGIQQAQAALESAQESLEDAAQALQNTTANFRILGHYDSLPELQSAITNPFVGDAYGVGDPTVVYVWNGSAWTQLPGVLVSPSLPMSVANGGTGGATVTQALANLGAQASNNLLVNPRFKYNSRSQQSYTGSGWTVDGWYGYNVTQAGNVLTAQQTGANIAQPIKRDLNLLYGKSIAFSIATSGASVVFGTATVPQSFSSTVTVGSASAQWGSIAVYWDSSVSQLKFGINLNQGQSITITAAKLELGSVSTLQAELDNPPPEDVEKLKLDMYDLDPGRCAYLPWHNENLLDNWYFVGGGSQQGGGQFPINQRGQTSYSGNKYGIDRWHGSNYGNVTINSDGISLSSSEDPMYLANIYDVNFANRLVGKTVTISALVNEDKLLSASGIVPPHNPNAEQFICSSVISGLTGIRLYFRQNDFIVQFRVDAGDTLDIQAVKLELGYLSTLARKDESGNWVLNDPAPNFQQELAKCQRYLLVPSNSSDIYPSVGIGTTFTANDAQILIPLPVSMRVKPTVTMNGNWTLRGGGGALLYLPDGSYSAVASTLSPSVATIIINATGVTLPINQAVELLRNNDPTGQLILSADL